ncbi:MAG: hypothetical protein IKP71_10995 [Candidatus Riflebacteria bacterium]|nr:hypothetical protein [Candidatus Riflebacteria bacterium]
MGTKKRSKYEETTLAGMTLRKTTTTTEQKTFLGIGYGAEREVSKKTEYLPNVSGKSLLKGGLTLAGKALEHTVRKKLP